MEEDEHGRADAERRGDHPPATRVPLSRLVIDASAAFQASLAVDGFDLLVGRRLVAPGLLWSETLSAIHESAWRGELSEELAREARGRVLAAPIDRRTELDLHREAWDVADELGWARTYDAEYVALARVLNCPLLTLDGRLRRGAARVIEVLAPEDL